MGSAPSKNIRIFKEILPTDDGLMYMTGYTDNSVEPSTLAVPIGFVFKMALKYRAELDKIIQTAGELQEMSTSGLIASNDEKTNAKIAAVLESANIAREYYPAVLEVVKAKNNFTFTLNVTPGKFLGAPLIGGIVIGAVVLAAVYGHHYYASRK